MKVLLGLLLLAFIAQLDPTLEEISDVKTAVSEAVTNAIIHGYNEDKSTNVIINVSIEDEEENENDKYKVIISVIDHGCGIDDIVQAKRAFVYIKT